MIRLIYKSSLVLMSSIILMSLHCCAQVKPKDKEVVTADELKTLIDNGLDAVLLDVRTPKEVANGVLPGAEVIDFQSVDFRHQIGALDKEKTYYVYCHVGGRSAKARDIMLSLGFTSVIDYKGGFKEWQAKGYPLVQK